MQSRRAALKNILASIGGITAGGFLLPLQALSNEDAKGPFVISADRSGIEPIAINNGVGSNNKNIPHNKIVCFGDSITKGDARNYPDYLKKLLTSSTTDSL